ncbi:Hypothetical predicted protein [Mytilus galloprovincialis]|uniref:Endonuclease/exonuclease/phosphatase domain-containing protein n=1 Tax=Mytilus galloprovincialis TaxID=29158 RepID=A0A8B6BF79_MYTGA|nr:Hypothetical predicted protein [Mytilus galloprovincialis]
MLKVTIENDSEDGILWVKFTNMENSSNMFYVSVVYLPPEFSARSVNAHNFFDVLMEQIYSIPKGNSFYLCGDFNSRLGNYTDFIQGIDQLSERNITDFTTNSNGEIFSEFLSTVNCCVLNGRYPIHDDFTYVSTKGLSVVDYCVVPYESLCHYKNFKVISVLCNKSAQPGSFRANHIPDHSVLCWEFETNFDNINEICSIDLSHSAHNSLNQQNNTYVLYDVKNIPSDWMTNNDILDKINMCIDNIQCSKGRQFEVDKLYNNFVEILHSEMNDKLETKVKVLNSTNNRKRRIKKPWWNDKLTNKWNIVCTAERDYVTCKHGSLKQQLRKDFVDKRKDFDKLTQKYKRQYWYRCQEELVNFSDNDTNQFWRRIGQIGIGNERQMRIPNEVTLDDGTISNNLETVLNKWKSSFHSLLNPNVNATDYNKVENCILKENIICIDLDKEITIDEVHKVVMNAKNCKSAGIDLIQAEFCKNISIISILHKLFNLCFSSGNVPKYVE